MTQLRSCYFCGAVGDSLQEYEVVPERLVAPDGSRSAVLCSTCHEKLRRVLEPLVEAAETATSPDRSVDSLDEVTFGSAEQSEEDESDAPEEATEDADDPETTADDEPPEQADDPEPASSETDDEPAAETEDVPDGYYKVIRLLQNREFPMERDALTGMVTGAYDVTEPQCERILQTAIDRGVLVEDGATIDSGRN
ncbi:hypothetical protein [Haloplanus sp. C73]|uniref:hypothetical protein n=1 Tax=Haloplanus sp. C73 TaxID=3421641 RepID=UPI003EBDCC27